MKKILLFLLLLFSLSFSLSSAISVDDFSLADLGSSSFVVEATLDASGSAQVLYGKTGALGSATSLASLSTEHLLQVDGLESNTVYFYRVVGKDASGNSYSSAISLTRTPKQIGTSDSSQSSNGVLEYDYNAKTDFGAKGDGVTDDTSALENAFNMVTSNHGTLYIPQGTYKVRKSAIKISGNDFKIIGDGEQTIITIPGQDTITWGAILEIRDSDNWELRDITIDGNWNNVPGNAQQGIANLIIRRSNYWVIDNVIGQNNWYGNIQMGDITHAVIRNSKSINTDCAIITYADTSDVLVENNFMDGHHWSEPIAFYAGNHNNIIIRGNTLKNKGYAHAILIGKSDRSSEVHQNILIENNNLYKVNGGVGVLYGINKDIIIRENIIYAQNDPINVKNGENIVIEDNNLDASWGGVPGSKGGQTWTGADNPSSKGHNGILIASSNGVSIQNNDISGYGWNCIYDGGSSNVEKLNNECS